MSTRTADAAFAKLRTRKAIDALGTKDGVLTKVPQFDQLQKKRLRALSATMLTTLTFRSLDDSDAATVEIARELIRRRDTAAQNSAVKVVLAVMKKCDPVACGRRRRTTSMRIRTSMPTTGRGWSG
ncbi:hypothetical protein [Hyalangium versicolor]|uniref:hypothetical protein n=1 Tax=Hyalangium versicolor TaxID=2861190 RepID=UPI001CCC5F60|nr:hypothetical protein [Hyalangium versicolor]